MKKKLMFLFVLALAFFTVHAQERGTPIFSDNFDVKGTFIENWKPAGKAENENGVVTLNGTSIAMKREAPDEFWASVKIALQEPSPENKAKPGFAGFDFGGAKFMLRPDGKAWMVYNVPNDKRARGTIRNVDGFQFGKSYTLTLIRRKISGGDQLLYRINNQDVGTAVIAAPPKNTPLMVFSYRETAIVDDFQLFSLKKGDESSNTAVNSSFEYLQEGIPTYFDTDTPRHYSFKRPYEEYLKTFSVDTAEKHSGKQSLRLVFDESCVRQGVQTFDTGMVVGQPMTFSVYLKADRDNFPVTLTIWEMRTKWHRKEIRLSKEWQRYEFSIPSATQSAVRVGLQFTQPGTVWVDDIQTEIADKSSPYRPSNLDQRKLAADKADFPPVPPLQAKKLSRIPAMDGNLDSWKDGAWSTDRFFYKDGKPQQKNTLYLGCDDENLYLGLRAGKESLSSLKTEPTEYDTFKIFGQENIEILPDPGRSKKNYYQLVASAAGSRTDLGPGRNPKWNGPWSVAVKRNEKEKSIDYEVKIPFALLAMPGAANDWGLNIGRSDTASKEAACLTPYYEPNFHKVSNYPVLKIPEEIVRNYAIGIVAPKVSTLKDGRFQLSGVVENNTGKDLRVTLSAVDSKDNKPLGSADLSLKKGNNSFSMTVPAGDFKNSPVIFTIKTGGKDLCIQYARPEEFSLFSAYTHLNYYMNEPEALFRVSCALEKPETLTARLKCGKLQAESKAAEEFTMRLPLKNLPDGTHEAVIELYGNSGKVAETKCVLVKKPFRKGAVQINQHRRCLVMDGQNILPFMPLITIWPFQKNMEDVVKFLADNGFKSAMIVISRNATENAKKFIEEAEKQGIKVLYWDGQTRTMSDEQLAGQAKMLGNYSNILANLAIDEPELYTKSDETRALLSRVRAQYPYLPVFMNNTVIGIPNRFADLNTDILMLDDYLTNKENRAVREIVDQADIMWRAGKSEYKPCYYFLVGNNMHNHYREPTAAEQVAETYGSIAANCTGLTYFLGIPSYPEHWKAYLALNREIIALNDAILSDEAVPDAALSDATLRAITRKHNGFLYIIASNIDNNPSADVVITLPSGLKYDDNAEVMFENRKLKVSNGKLTDSFPALSRHVYKVKLR